jgi:hypothetical protein
MSIDPSLLDEIDHWTRGATHPNHSVAELEFRKIEPDVRIRIFRGTRQRIGTVRDDGTLSLRVDIEGAGYKDWPIRDQDTLDAMGRALANRRSMIAPAIAGTPEAIEFLMNEPSFKAAWERWDFQRSVAPGKP